MKKLLTIRILMLIFCEHKAAVNLVNEFSENNAKLSPLYNSTEIDKCGSARYT